MAFNNLLKYIANLVNKPRDGFEPLEPPNRPSPVARPLYGALGNSRSITSVYH